MTRTTGSRGFRRTVIRETGTFFLLVLAMAGCATRGRVDQEVGSLAARDQKLAELESRLASLEAAIEESETALVTSRSELAAAQERAALASDHARRAEAGAGGHLLGETVFRLDGVAFEPGTAALTADSVSALTATE